MYKQKLTAHLSDDSELFLSVKPGVLGYYERFFNLLVRVMKVTALRKNFLVLRNCTLGMFSTK